jgi:quinol---cytochrome c reductase cytochrome c subunit, bacillus type
MSEKNNKFEAGIGSNALKAPRRIVFITPKTSAKVKEKVAPEVMSYPQLILRGVIAFEVLTILLVIVSLVWDAPLEQLANPLLTPNPAKAPWYFLGLQELLHYFPPLVAGIVIPGLVVVALVVIPYFNVNIKGEPLWAADRSRRFVIFMLSVGVLLIFLALYQAWTVLAPTVIIAGLAVVSFLLLETPQRLVRFLRTRPLSWWVMTWFIAVALTLTVVGTFFRGPGWSWVWPWR